MRVHLALCRYINILNQKIVRSYKILQLIVKIGKISKAFQVIIKFLIQSYLIFELIVYNKYQ